MITLQAEEAEEDSLPSVSGYTVTLHDMKKATSRVLEYFQQFHSEIKWTSKASKLQQSYRGSFNVACHRLRDARLTFRAARGWARRHGS